MPIEKRLQSLQVILSFFASVVARDYVAVDFYDGSILYDFETDTTTICDIDLFQKKPMRNEMGEAYWGTKRLKAPEEYSYGAAIDEVTNVYTLGAMIFHIFGEYTDVDIHKMYEGKEFFPCSYEKWELSRTLYEVARKAVALDREERYGSISELSLAWKEASRRNIL